MGYIDWDKVTPRMKVKRVKQHYEAGGKTVLWSGHTARRAQSYLNSRVRSDAQKGRKR